jgi:hypothetical protein
MRNQKSFLPFHWVPKRANIGCPNGTVPWCRRSRPGPTGHRTISATSWSSATKLRRLYPSIHRSNCLHSSVPRHSPRACAPDIRAESPCEDRPTTACSDRRKTSWPCCWSRPKSSPRRWGAWWYRDRTLNKQAIHKCVSFNDRQVLLPTRRPSTTMHH